MQITLFTLKSMQMAPPSSNDLIFLKKYEICCVELGVNLNDIKSSAVLQPLTSDRPKNPAKNPPTKYGGPRSPVRNLFLYYLSIFYSSNFSFYIFSCIQKKTVTPEV